MPRMTSLRPPCLEVPTGVATLHDWENTTKQRENSFWKTHPKSFRVHLRVAVTVPTGSHAFPSADLVPVDRLLRPPHTQAYKIREQDAQHDTSVECTNNHLAATQHHESDDGAQTHHTQSQRINNSH
jgi:hypothetical protein